MCTLYVLCNNSQYLVNHSTSLSFRYVLVNTHQEMNDPVNNTNAVNESRNGDLYNFTRNMKQHNLENVSHRTHV